MFIINWLSGSGHRLSTGAPNSSGRLRVLSPGTQTEVTIFDANGETITQPVELDAAGKATVYVSGPVDLSFEDSSGAPAQEMPYGDLHGADGVLVESNAFTGALASGSRGAGGRTYLDAIAASALTSFKGVDWQPVESTSGVPRGLADTIFGIQLPVKGFGAKGDGQTDDTSAIQLAINRCIARGGGIVYFDPGTYKVTTALLISGATGVALVGAGASASVLRNTNATGSVLSFSSCTGVRVSDLGISHSSSSTSIGIGLADITGVTLQRVTIASHQTGVSLSGATSSTSITECNIQGTNAAASRAISYNTSGVTRYNAVDKCFLYGGTGGAGNPAIEYNGAVSDVTVTNTYFVSAFSAIRINSACTGQRFVVSNCPSVRNFTLPFDILTATDPQFQQTGNGVEGTTNDITSGSTFTPNWLTGTAIRVRGTSTGAAYTIAVPTLAPTTRGVRMSFHLFNNAAGAITGWNFAVGYRRDATAISLVDTHHNMVTFEYDIDQSVWRQVTPVEDLL